MAESRLTARSESGRRVADTARWLRWPSWWLRVPPLLLGAAVGIALTLLVIVGLLAFGVPFVGQPAPKAAAPPWRVGAVHCREAPMAHVHDPSRFVVVAKCATVSGTVRSAHLDPADGDLKIQVDVDSAYKRYLTPANQGLLTAAVIPSDQSSVLVPKAGQYVTLYGSWVLERILYGVGAVELHPCWGLEASVVDPGADPGAAAAQAASAAGAPHVDPNQSLAVKAEAPPSVRVGSLLAVTVSVQTTSGAALKPTPGAALYLEVVGDRGRLVQWKAAAANNLGTAKVNLLASGPPGNYTLWVYAHKGPQGGIVRTSFSVTPA